MPRLEPPQAQFDVELQQKQERKHKHHHKQHDEKEQEAQGQPKIVNGNMTNPGVVEKTTTVGVFQSPKSQEVKYIIYFYLQMISRPVKHSRLSL